MKDLLLQMLVDEYGMAEILRALGEISELNGKSAAIETPILLGHKKKSRRVHKRKMVKITDEMFERAKELNAGGMPWVKVAKKVGCSDSGLYYALKNRI
jgi:hypothetical protein